MARNKEIAVILLDVGPEMEDALPYASRAVQIFIAEKVRLLTLSTNPTR